MKRITILFIALAISLNLMAQDGQRSEHYYDRVKQFSQEKPICSSDIVFLGNSLTEGGAWSDYFKDVEKRLSKKGGAIRNRGIVGDTVDGIEERLDEITDGHPKKLFFLCGVNDISHDLSSDSIVNMIRDVLVRIKEESPKTRIYLQSLLPFNESFKRYKNLNGKTYMVAEINGKLERLADELNVRFINLYPLFLEDGTESLNPSITPDGLHLKPEGYEIWVKAIEKYVK